MLMERSKIRRLRKPTLWLNFTIVGTGERKRGEGRVEKRVF
jgi:hypothetical protein